MQYGDKRLALALPLSLPLDPSQGQNQGLGVNNSSNTSSSSTTGQGHKQDSNPNPTMLTLWRRNLAMIIANKSSDWRSQVASLGDRLMKDPIQRVSVSVGVRERKASTFLTNLNLFPL